MKISRGTSLIFKVRVEYLGKNVDGESFVKGELINFDDAFFYCKEERLTEFISINLGEQLKNSFSGILTIQHIPENPFKRSLPFIPRKFNPNFLNFYYLVKFG